MNRRNIPIAPIDPFGESLMFHRDARERVSRYMSTVEHM